MHDLPILAYFPDPYGVGNALFAFEDEGNVSFLMPEQLASVRAVLSFEVPSLIEELRRAACQAPEFLMDLSDAIRLNTGISRADGGERKWDFWNGARKYFAVERDWRECREIFESRSIATDSDRAKNLLMSLIKVIRIFWQETRNELVTNGEWERFVEIEAKVASIFHKRQYRGFPINQPEAGRLVLDARIRKYKSYQMVAKILNISPTGLNYWNISAYISKTDFAGLNSDVTGYALRDRMKLAENSSSFASSFNQFMDASRDLDILHRLCAANGRVFPIIQSLGTISARVTVSDPPLQELRRSYRSVFNAEDGRTLIYLDYAQFEPGIMASIAGDVELMALYNSGDVYTALSVYLFGDENRRDLSKKVFLGFIYGMSPDAIARAIISKANEAETDYIKGRIHEFFDRFSALSAMKKAIEETLFTSGFITSKLGNKRKRVSSGSLKAKEKRWAISQVIQGTASLIFKSALIRLANEFGDDAILLPMHDAVLMQVEAGGESYGVTRATELMCGAFLEYCDGVTPRVVCSKF